jgi:hypothetical protein
VRTRCNHPRNWLVHRVGNAHSGVAKVPVYAPTNVEVGGAGSSGDRVLLEIQVRSAAEDGRRSREQSVRAH